MQRPLVSCRRGFFLPVLALSKLFRRLMLEKLAAAHKAGRLRFFGEHAHLSCARAFVRFLAPLKETDWFVYSKRPFSGPKAVLAYLARNAGRVLTHRQILQAAWGGQYLNEVDYVWTYVRRIRRRIEPDPSHPRFVLTEPGVGYRMPT